MILIRYNRVWQHFWIEKSRFQVYLYGGETEGNDGGDLSGLDDETADEDEDVEVGVATVLTLLERRCWYPPPPLPSIFGIQTSKLMDSLQFCRNTSNSDWFRFNNRSFCLDGIERDFL